MIRHRLLLLGRGAENLAPGELSQQRIQDLTLVLVADIDRVGRRRGVGDLGVARVWRAGGRGGGGGARGCQRGDRGVGGAVGRVGLRFGPDVEEGGPFRSVVAVDFDGDRGVAVFYAWQHFAPEFSKGVGISGCACIYVDNGCDFEENT